MNGTPHIETPGPDPEKIVPADVSSPQTQKQMSPASFASDDDLTLEEMTPWALPWKAISITLVVLILIAGAIQIVGLASNRIGRLSEASIRTHGKEPGNFRPMGGVVPHLSSSLPVVKSANGGIAGSLVATSQIKVNATGLAVPEGFVFVPAGPFVMGSDDPFANFDEKPVHKVYLPGFFVKKTLVTNVEYKKFIDQTQYIAPPGWHNRMYPVGKGDHPVTFVSYFNARDYAHWEGSRLCSEEEWEKSARGKDARLWPWGNVWDPRRANANYTVGDTTPVMRYAAGVSPYGLYDMAGNVFEWTRSDYSPYPGNVSNKARFLAYKVDATGALQQVKGRVYKILRGGSWKSDQYSARATARNPTWPDYASNFFGFRTCRDVKSN